MPRLLLVDTAFRLLSAGQLLLIALVVGRSMAPARIRHATVLLLVCVAAYLANHVGEVMEARITGVQNFGFFATIEGVGGDGLVPVRDLGTDYFRYDEAGHKLVGEDSGQAFALGQRLPLRLVEANPVSGALRYELPDGKGSAGGGDERRGKAGPKRVLKHRGRPANIRHQSRKR